MVTIETLSLEEDGVFLYKSNENVVVAYKGHFSKDFGQQGDESYLKLQIFKTVIGGYSNQRLNYFFELFFWASSVKSIIILFLQLIS
ncbi:hypothetical protein NF867_13090 [Solitalea sp. MAHUQ-68]|uniref:Uncharacterized protein n=1 Tax=Solitalea agri TaxID=2953739 RepID=A0A9X2JEC0_9SPHI|nr:hypothetical protein [Solitalea agri]MCO4293800.1 hypothetical protein [Solitalea agri]